MFRETLPFTSLSLALLTFVQTGSANPGSKVTDAGIAVHGKEVAGPIQGRAQSLYEDGNTALNSFVEAANDGRLARLGVKPLGQAHVKLTTCRRLGRQLAFLGETAGIDYERRASYLLTRLDELIVKYRNLPTSRKAVDQIRRALQKQAPARAKQLQKLQKLAIEKKWTAAETELYKTLDTLELVTVFLSNEEQVRIYAPFGEVRSAIEAAMYQFRGAKGKEHLVQRFQQEMPDLKGLLSEMQAAPAALASNGKAMSGGMLLSGPEIVADFGNRWQAAQVGILRCRTLESVIRKGGIEGEYPDGSEQPASKVVTDYLQFTRAALPLLGQMIEADATRVSDADAVELYVQYLKTLAPLVRRSAGRSLAPAVIPALQKLAIRAPSFPNEVAAYDDATGDLLRWRNRVAMARAKSKVDEYEPVESRFFNAAKSRDSYIGLFVENDTSPIAATLNTASPLVVAGALEGLKNKKVSVIDIVRLPNQGKASIARYRGRTYANLPAPLDLEAEVDALKFDLMVTEQEPPVTLLTAVAVDSAERGDLASAGGPIANFYLESVATRFGSLPVTASVLTPFGTIPQEPKSYSFANQVLMRFDIRPDWAQHDYFFVTFARSQSE